MLSKSHSLAFQLLDLAEQAPLSCHLIILKIACIYWFGALQFEIALNHDDPLNPHFLLISLEAFSKL